MKKNDAVVLEIVKFTLVTLLSLCQSRVAGRAVEDSKLLPGIQNMRSLMSNKLPGPLFRPRRTTTRQAS